MLVKCVIKYIFIARSNLRNVFYTFFFDWTPILTISLRQLFSCNDPINRLFKNYFLPCKKQWRKHSTYRPDETSSLSCRKCTRFLAGALEVINWPQRAITCGRAMAIKTDSARLHSPRQQFRIYKIILHGSLTRGQKNSRHFFLFAPEWGPEFFHDKRIVCVGNDRDWNIYFIRFLLPNNKK